jgi:hypothetical protein
VWTDAFSSLKHLQEVTIPSSVTSLYAQAFHGYGKEHEQPLTIILQHDEFTKDLLASYAFYDLPKGSNIFVENEKVKETIQALDPAFATLFETEEKITIEVNSPSTVEPTLIEKNIILYLLELIKQMLKNCTPAFN